MPVEPTFRIVGPSLLRKACDELFTSIEVNGVLVSVRVTLYTPNNTGTPAKRARETMRAEIQSHLESLG